VDKEGKRNKEEVKEQRKIEERDVT